MTQVGSYAMEKPSYVPQGEAGTEHMTKDDLRLPMLKIAQQMSPQINPEDPSFIEGLQSGSFFVDISGKILGKGPHEVVILRADKARYVQFAPGQGGGVLDGNVPPDDPRTKFTVGPNNERIKPIATKFYDFVVAIPPISVELTNYFVMSLKGASLRQAATLNTFMKQSRAPIYCKVYGMTAVATKNQKGTFFIPWFRDLGWLPKDSMDAAGVLFESLRDKSIKFDETPPDRVVGEDDDLD